MLGIDPSVARTAWSRAVIYTAVGILLCVIWITRKTLLVFATALMFAYLLYPLVDAIDRRLSRKNRVMAVTLPFVTIFGAITIFVLFIRAPLIGEYHTLQGQLAEKGFKQEVTEWKPLGLPIGEHIGDALDQNEIMGMMPEISRAMRTTVRYLVNLFIIPILSFVILKDGRSIRDRVLDLIESRQRAESIMMDAHDLLLEYMRSLLVLCLATLVSFTVGLSLMKTPYPILLALAAFVLEFVPMVGPLTAGVLIVGVCTFNNYPHVAWTVSFLVAYRLFQDYVLSPHLMEKGVKLHPLLVLFGVFAGGEIGNIPGIFLSVPVLALLRLAFYEWRKPSLPIAITGAET
jgi:predicted PurR-regulated permease PerM